MTAPPRKKLAVRNEDKVTLKTIAQHLGLTPGTVSAALNNSPAARSIPEHTKNRIIEAAQAQLPAQLFCAHPALEENLHDWRDR